MNRIKEIRKKKKLTLQQVSNETGISVSSLSAYEKEKNEKGYRAPKLDKLLTLANFFDVPLVSLFEMDTAKVESQLINSAFSKWYGVSHWGKTIPAYCGKPHSFDLQYGRKFKDSSRFLENHITGKPVFGNMQIIESRAKWDFRNQCI